MANVEFSEAQKNLSEYLIFIVMNAEIKVIVKKVEKALNMY